MYEKKQYLLGMKKEKSGLTLNAGKVEKFSDNTCVSFVNLTVTKIDLVTRKKEGNTKNF